MKAPAERPVLNFTGRCSADLRTIKAIFYTQVAALQLSIHVTIKIDDGL